MFDSYEKSLFLEDKTRILLQIRRRCGVLSARKFVFSSEIFLYMLIEHARRHNVLFFIFICVVDIGHALNNNGSAWCVCGECKLEIPLFRRIKLLIWPYYYY